MADNKVVKDVHVDFNKIEQYLRFKTYPTSVKSKGEKANFRRASKKFSLEENGQLMKKGGKKVIISKERRIEIIHDVHEGLGESAKAKALSSHRDKNRQLRKFHKFKKTRKFTFEKTFKTSHYFRPTFPKNCKSLLFFLLFLH